MDNKKKIVFGSAAGIGAIVTVLMNGLYIREGDYVNNKADRGGATRFGVTQSVARDDGYKGNMKEFPKFCYEGETNTCADKIYFETYIERPGLIPLLKASPSIGDELFDTGVNMGPYYPSLWLQQALNEECPSLPGKKKLTADGKTGPGTQAYFISCQTTIGKVKFCNDMLTRLDGKQKARYDAIVRGNPSQKIFYKGWINWRIGNVNRKQCEVDG